MSHPGSFRTPTREEQLEKENRRLRDALSEIAKHAVQKLPEMEDPPRNRLQVIVAMVAGALR